MKMRKDKDILRLLRVGLVVVLLGAVILIFQTHSKNTFFIGFGLIFAGLFMFARAVYTATKPKTELIVDERITRINEKAGYNAGWMVMVSVIILFWADKFWSLGIELEDMYWTTLFVGAYSWLILRWYYNRRGEVV
ncbi:MAG: hypothetical protein C5S48_03535 [Candidatus Methanogaster sp.]|nr:MAG: hypothetical protein C5S48_03535 [ANME-2 cluster archaeon]